VNDSAPIILSIAARDLGWNRALGEGFELGTLAGGGYGVKWRSPDAPGLGSWSYWVAWEHPHAPIRIDFKGRGFVVCLDSATDDELQRAPSVAYEREQNVR